MQITQGSRTTATYDVEFKSPVILLKNQADMPLLEHYCSMS